MLCKKINRFWRNNLTKSRILLLVLASMVIFTIGGCSYKSPKVSDIEITSINNETCPSNQNNYIEAENIAAVYRDIYNEAIETNTLGSLEIIRRIVARLGENGYVAIDSKNQVNMSQAEQTEKFCKAVEEKENAQLTIVEIMETGFRKFDLKTDNGKVNIIREYYEYDRNGNIQNRNTASYPADFWKYTEEGYLIFEGSCFLDENFVLTLSDTHGHTVLRVLPLDEKCRELNRKYILPVGYIQNNIFLCNWSEEDYEGLDFYDIFDNFYPIFYGQPVPYAADENLGVGKVYQIPENIFENVIMTYFHIDTEILRSKTKYIPEYAAYEYKPRGFYEIEYPDIPYPEVVSYTENPDGTITLSVNAVYPKENTSKLYSHKTIIRLLDEDYFQYVSNQTISLEDAYSTWWHSNRLTEEEWNKIYGGNQ